jgi:hypothetical protein
VKGDEGTGWAIEMMAPRKSAAPLYAEAVKLLAERLIDERQRLAVRLKSKQEGEAPQSLDSGLF